MKSAMTCNHANEMPAECPCEADCYCKRNSCRKRNTIYCKTFGSVLYWLRQQGYQRVDAIINRSVGSQCLGLDGDMDYVLRYTWHIIYRGKQEYYIPIFQFPQVDDHYNGNQTTFWITKYMEVSLG